MPETKYLIIFDTNCLGNYGRDKNGSNNKEINCTNFRYLATAPQFFTKLLNFIETQKIHNKVKIVIPKLVLEEIKSQQISQFNKELDSLRNTFKKFEDLEGFNLKTSYINYSELLRNTTNKFCDYRNLKIIDYPCNEVLPKLINKAVYSHKPFSKANKFSDCGFKDAVIWESILEYARSNKDYDYIFLTSDKAFNDDKLRDEFRTEIGKDIAIYREISQVKEYLDEQIKLNLSLKRIMTKIDYNVIKNLTGIIKNYQNGIRLNGQIYEIVDVRIFHDILDVEKMENDYLLYLPVKFVRTTDYTGYGVVDQIYSYYEYKDFSDTLIVKIDENLNLKKLDFGSGVVVLSQDIPKTVNLGN